jgi:hypothetical protein
MEARSLDISGIHFLQFQSKKTLEIGTVTLNRPVFILTNADINPPKIDSLPNEDTINLYALMKDKIKSIEIGKIQVVKGSGLIRGNDTTNLSLKIGEFNIQCSGLLLDSTIAASGKKIKLGNMNAFAGDCNGHISKGLYQISIPAIHLNGLDSALVIDSISVTPTVDKKQFSKKVGYQTDCIELRLTGLRLSSGGFENLVDNQEILLAIVEIDSVRMHAYRDKNIPRRTEHHDLHHTFLKNLPYSIEIEKVILHRGDITYEELAEGAPQSGHISFTRMEGVVHNISNINMDDTIRFKGSAYMMNQAAISATISLPLAEDKFFGSADMGPFDLAILNPMIKNFAPVDITDGKAQSMKMWFSANETAGMGEMTFTYSGFVVNTGEKEKDKSDNTVVGEIKDFIANEIILVQDNPKNDVLRVEKLGTGETLPGILSITAGTWLSAESNHRSDCRR